jgi:hypothetical protein
MYKEIDNRKETKNCRSGTDREKMRKTVYSNYEEKETIYTRGRCCKLRGKKGVVIQPE